MYRDQIIQRVNNDSQIMAACRYYTKNSDLFDDLWQELHLTILEMDDTRAEQLHGWGERVLRWWCIRTMLNMYRSYTSGFAKKYRHNDFRTGQFDTSKIADSEIEFYLFECGYNDVAKEIEADSWFDWGLFELWQKEGSVRKVALKTGIPVSTVAASVKRASDKIKERIK